MAYSFFTNGTAHKSSRTPLSPTYTPNNSNNSKQFSIHPNPPRPPPPPSPNARRDTDNPESQPSPYPDALESHPTPHPQISIDPVNTAHIPSLTRITGLLLPIRYPNGFYTATITDPIIASLSRVAIYHDNAPPTTKGTTNPDSSTDKVIGGIRCRLEPLPGASAPSDADQPVRRNLYIQTLLLLSPYRGNGVATSLLSSLLFEPSSHSSDTSTPTSSDKPPVRPLSALVKHYGIRTVTAHVHEINEDALHWYIARGFKVEPGIVEGYYRRLKPGGARIVRLTLPWDGDEEQVQREEPNNGHDEDDDWEKIEAEEVDDTSSSKAGSGGGIKRKADDAMGR
ncbi:hypothetical protein FQN54_002349 [Arachnomyces sp. PD_36]|nr:hypothetical protein FQN54_002349 [Arachnomyces sp. PD_36]